MPLDIVILGPPGAGKGTQAKLIAKDAGIPHIATGDIIREMKEQDTDLGREVKTVYDRGDLVPDDLIIELIRERLSQPDTAGGFVLDGFPRTLEQAEALDQTLAEIDRKLSVALHFQIPDELAIERLHVRAIQEGRTDDAPEVARHRYEVYHRSTEPVTEHFRSAGILVGIHADRTIEDVFAEVQQVLQAAAAR